MNLKNDPLLSQLQIRWSFNNQFSYEITVCFLGEDHDRFVLKNIRRRQLDRRITPARAKSLVTLKNKTGSYKPIIFFYFTGESTCENPFNLHKYPLVITLVYRNHLTKQFSPNRGLYRPTLPSKLLNDLV